MGSADTLIDAASVTEVVRTFVNLILVTPMPNYFLETEFATGCLF